MSYVGRYGSRLKENIVGTVTSKLMFCLSDMRRVIMTGWDMGSHKMVAGPGLHRGVSAKAGALYYHFEVMHILINT